MFFESYGSLDGLTTVEALKKFCEVVNPIGKAFHPSFFLKIIEAKEKRKRGHGRLFNIPSAIKGLLRVSYEFALKQHLEQNPFGPLPIEISIRNFEGYCTLQYKTTKMTRIEIQIPTPYASDGSTCRMGIFGPCKPEIFRRAMLAGLPEPVKKPKLIPVVQLPSHPLPVELVNFADVKIPLGDLLDFVAKYRQ
jgi:hypothetical protein